MEYEITHQECTPAEQAKAEAEIRELQRKKEMLRQQGQERLQLFKDTTNRTMQRLAEKATELAAAEKALSECALPTTPGPPLPPELNPYRLVDLLAQLKSEDPLPAVDQQLQIMEEAFKLK